MRNLFIILSLVFFGCDNPLIHRMSADYFPMETAGNRWEFESEDGVKLLLLSSGEAMKGDRDCFLVERNYSPEYWYEDSRELAKYEIEYHGFGGERIVLTGRWVRYLELPLVLGNSWSDSVDVQKTVSGEDVQRKVMSRGEVEAIEFVDVQAGRFDHCYKVKMTKSRETLVDSILLESDTTLTYEWYAPDVGLVKFSENGTVYNLIRVTIHN